MYYKYLLCQISSHDDKSDFLNYKFSIRLPPLLNSNIVHFKRESWVKGGFDVIQSRLDTNLDKFSGGAPGLANAGDALN